VGSLTHVQGVGVKWMSMLDERMQSGQTWCNGFPFHSMLSVHACKETCKRFLYKYLERAAGMKKKNEMP